MDIQVENHGSVVLFRPVSETAIGFCEERFPGDCLRFGVAYAVEPRLAGAIVEDMEANGLDLG